MKTKGTKLDVSIRPKEINDYTSNDLRIANYIYLLTKTIPIIYVTNTVKIKLLYIKVLNEMLVYVINDTYTYVTIRKKIKNDLKYLKLYSNGESRRSTTRRETTCFITGRS